MKFKPGVKTVSCYILRCFFENHLDTAAMTAKSISGQNVNDLHAHAALFYQLLILSHLARFWRRSRCLYFRRQSYNFCHSDHQLPIFCHTTIWTIFFYKNIQPQCNAEILVILSISPLPMHKLSLKYPNCLHDTRHI